MGVLDWRSLMGGGRLREVVAHGGSTELGNQGNTTLMAELQVLYNQAPLLIFELPPPPPRATASTKRRT